MHGSTIKRGAAIALLILLVFVGWLFYTNGKNDEAGTQKALEAATALKQEIASYKSRRNHVPAAQKMTLPPEFEMALRAELRGDEQFTSRNYQAAEKSYAEALDNFKKALAEFEAANSSPTLAEAASPQESRQQSPSAPPASRVTAEEIENFSRRSLERERKLLAAESQTNPAQKPEAFTPQTSSPPTTSFTEKHTAAAANTAVLQEEHRLKQVSQPGPSVPETASATALGGVSGEAPSGSGMAPGRAFDSATSLDSSLSRLDRSAQAEDNAERDIANLLNAYQTSLAASDLEGLKALFHENFVFAHEKAWSDFFAQATNVRVRVERKNYKITAAGGEVDLAVTIAYSNRRGTAQKPLQFSERWTLAHRNGAWSVAARHFD